MANSTVSSPDFDGGTVLMQARTTLPFTSISQAPQLPPRHPVGILTPAVDADGNQSLPTRTCVTCPFGHVMVMCRSVIDSSFCGQQRRQIHMLLEGIGESIEQLVTLVAVVG